MHRPTPSGLPDPALPSPPLPPVARGAVDVGILEDMVGREPEVVQDFLRQYLASARAIMADLRAAHAAGELAGIGSALHKLKSSSRAVGALGFGDLCAQIESAATQQHGAEVAASIPPLELAFAAVERAITVHLGTS